MKFALTGFPLGHSISPEIHKALFALSGADNADYFLLPIEPEAFGARFSELEALDGFNVTIPFKQTIIPFLSGLDDSAARYHSVNVVLNRSGILTGYNTDMVGFLKSVERLGTELAEKSILVLGYGGAGRMFAAESLHQGAKRVSIAARGQSIEGAEALAKELSSAYPGSEVFALPLSDVSERYDLIINATPSGMFPHCDTTPVGADALAGPGFLFDAVYNPEETKLMKLAASKGLRVLGGMTMLVYQAAAAHEIWYGATFSDEALASIIQSMEALIRSRNRDK